MALKSKGQLYGTALVLGFPVTLVLFYIMATLVSQPVDLGSSADEQIIDFVRVASQSSLQTRQRSMPKKPPKPQKAPDMPKMSVNSQVDAPQPQMAMTSPLASDSPFLWKWSLPWWCSRWRRRRW